MGRCFLQAIQGICSDGAHQVSAASGSDKAKQAQARGGGADSSARATQVE